MVALIPVAKILRTLKQGCPFVKGKERFNHLLFMDDLKLYGSNEIDSSEEVVKILSGDNGMQFRFDKCTVLKMKRGKQVHCQGNDLGDGIVIEEGCNFLGILERHKICQQKMKGSKGIL